MNPFQYLAVEMRDNSTEYRYIHNGHARISTAFEINDRTEIKLLIPRAIGTTAATLELFDESVTNAILHIEGAWCGVEGDKDSYLFSIPNIRLGTGLYFMRPRLCALCGILFGHKDGEHIRFNRDGQTYGLLQLTITSFVYPEPKRLRGGVIYHIFVDRFRRGGKAEIPDTAVMVDGEWEKIAEYPEYPGAPLTNNTFYGGTLWGIIEKLDYIRSLGTTAIYLSPIFESVSNHKYDTANYMRVDPMFGGDEALRALVYACKNAGIELILDGVFNHTGSDSIYFNSEGRYKVLGACQSTESPFYDWFDFQSYPNEYSSWWGIKILPKINPDKKKCGDYFVGEGGVIEKYSRMGVYGFRLDVADELSDEFIGRIKEKHAEICEDSILYGEVWEDASNKCSYGRRRRYYQGRELDGVMNYPVRSGIIDFILGYGCAKLDYALREVSANAPERVLNNQMNLLGTHDTERILTILGGQQRGSRSNSELAVYRMDEQTRNLAINRLKTAYTLLSTLPGIPTVFYGDEVGLEGFGDPFNRMPYPWDKENEDLLSHYRRLGKIRRDNTVYGAGGFKLLHLDDQLLIFKRYDSRNDYVTVVNNAPFDLELSFECSACSLLKGISATTHLLPGNCAEVYKLKRGATLEIN